jgi:hypothetical protein
MVSISQTTIDEELTSPSGAAKIAARSFLALLKRFQALLGPFVSWSPALCSTFFASPMVLGILLQMDFGLPSSLDHFRLRKPL